MSTGNVLHPKALSCSCREPPRSLPENRWMKAGMCRDEAVDFLVTGVVGPPEGSAGWPAVRSDAAGSSGGRKGRWVSVGLFLFHLWGADSLFHCVLALSCLASFIAFITFSSFVALSLASFLGP